MKNKDRLYIALYTRGGAPKMPGKEDTYATTSPLSVQKAQLLLGPPHPTLTPSTQTPEP